MELNQHIEIKGVSKDDPNCEGRVVEITDNGVYIANLNMPYMGTYARKFVAYEDIES